MPGSQVPTVGDEFGNFSTFEMGEPFRIVLDLRKKQGPSLAVTIPGPGVGSSGGTQPAPGSTGRTGAPPPAPAAPPAAPAPGGPPPGSEERPPHWSEWFRVVDTRSAVGGSRLAAGATLTVPSTTGAVVNVTATGPASPGYLTVHPCDAVPWVSNANYGAGDVVPALAAVGTAGGGFCVTSSAATDVVVDRLATLVNS